MSNKYMNANKKILILSILDVLILSYGHTINVNLIILIGLFGFCALVLLSPKQAFLPIMLFYLPWSPIMKFNQGDFTFYTIIVILFFLALLLITGANDDKGILKLDNILVACLFIVYTMIIKLFLEQNFSMSYLMFIFMLVFIPTYLNLYHSKISFEFCIISFSTGIITAGFASKILMEFPHMLQYIDVYEWKKVGLTRLSGFYGDANFYSSHILVAICGLLIISINKQFKDAFQLYIVVIVLIYLGLLSVSKMFLLVLMAVIGLWILAVLLQKGKINTKIRIVFCFVMGVIFIITSGIFTDLINMYLIRFGMVKDTSSLTTGRSDILENYISFFENNPISLLFGQGYSSVFSGGINSSAHDTLVQALYQLGILGSIFLVIWIFQLSILTSKVNNNNSTKISGFNVYTIAFAVACFFPWFSLDILFFDEFFYITALYFIGRNYILCKNKMDLYKGKYKHNY